MRQNRNPLSSPAEWMMTIVVVLILCVFALIAGGLGVWFVKLSIEHPQSDFGVAALIAFAVGIGFVIASAAILNK